MKTDNMAQVAEYWNKVAPDFDKIYSGEKGPFSRAMDKWLRADMYERLRWVMEASGDIAGKRVCDVGCGSGRFLVGLGQKGAAQLMGVDVAPNMIDLARKHTAEAGFSERSKFAVTDVLNWKVDEEPFDLTIAIGFWDYIDDPISRLEKIRAITKKGGIFLSAWPRSGTLRAIIRKPRLAMLGCPSYYYSKDQVYRDFAKTGFKPRDYRIAGQLHLVEAEAV